jgi:hypothetical protein
MKFILAIVMLVVTGMQANSQCDKNVTWYAVKGEMYDTNGGLLDTKSDSIFLVTEPQKISLRFKSDDKELEGTVTKKSCDWKEPYKNGKTVYNTTVILDGVSSSAVFTLEATNGKIILTLEIDSRGGRKFVIYIEGYKEVK